MALRRGGEDGRGVLLCRQPLLVTPQLHIFPSRSAQRREPAPAPPQLRRCVAPSHMLLPAIRSPRSRRALQAATCLKPLLALSRVGGVAPTCPTGRPTRPRPRRRCERRRVRTGLPCTAFLHPTARPLPQYAMARTRGSSPCSPRPPAQIPFARALGCAGTAVCAGAAAHDGGARASAALRSKAAVLTHAPSDVDP